MKDKIEVGEFVRTVDGKFGIFDRYSTRKDDSFYKSPFDCFIKLQKRKTPLQCCRDYIANHSFDSKELIEVGDIVEFIDVLNEEVIYIWDKEMLEAVKQDIEEGQTLKSILTKEEFTNRKYKF